MLEPFPSSPVDGGRILRLLAALIIPLAALALATSSARHRRIAEVDMKRAEARQTLAVANAELLAGDHAAAADTLRSIAHVYRGPEWGFLMHEADPSLRTLQGHYRPVNAIVFHPDGSSFVSAGYYANIWDAKTGCLLGWLNADTPISALAFSPDGTQLYAGTGRGDLYVWRWSDRTLITRHTLHTSKLAALDVSPDGRLIATASWDGTARLIDLETTETRHEYQVLTSGPMPIAFAPDGADLAVRDERGIQLWNVSTNAPGMRIDTEQFSSLQFAFSPDNSQLVANTRADGALVAYDRHTGAVMNTGAPVQQYMHYGWRYNQIAFHPSGMMLAACMADRTIRILDSTTLEERAQLTGHSNVVSAIAFSPTGTRLASGSLDRTVRVWSVPPRQRPMPFERRRMIGTLTADDDGSTIIAGQFQISIVNVDDGSSQTLDRSRFNNVHAVAINPTDRTVATSTIAHENGRVVPVINVWSQDLNHQLATLRGHVEPEPNRWAPQIDDLTYSPDGTLLASACTDRTIRIWDMATHEELAVLRGHREPPLQVEFSPNGAMLVSAGGQDKSVGVWDLKTFSAIDFIRPEEYVAAVAFHPDGQSLVFSAANDGIHHYRLSDGRVTRIISTYARTLCYTPDGTRLIGSSDNFIRIWDAQTGRELAMLPPLHTPVEHLVIDTSGRRLISGTIREIRLWEDARYDEGEAESAPCSPMFRHR